MTVNIHFKMTRPGLGKSILQPSSPTLWKPPNPLISLKDMQV